MLKNKSFIITVILPIFISIIVGVVIIVLNSNSILKTQASTAVALEEKKMNQEITTLKSQKSELSVTAAEYDQTLEDNRLLLEEVTALKEELNDYTSSIEKAKETITELDNSIAEKTAYNENLSQLSSNNPGNTKSYTNTKLNVPSDIKAGRYKAEGKGTLMIYTIAGTLQDKQNLSIIDTHSYTFDISSGQSVKIDGTLSLTEISD